MTVETTPTDETTTDETMSTDVAASTEVEANSPRINTPGGSTHVQVVDGMRAVAVVLVIMLHYWSLSFYALKIPGLGPQFSLEFLQVAGSQGVELFFLISAFCLFYPHAKAMFGQGKVPTLRHFYYRRIIKIIPSYWLALATAFVFFPTLFGYKYGGGWFKDTLLHLTFVHNMLPDSRSTFVPALWSLAVEVQFYYIFPLLAWVFRRRPLLTLAGMTAAAVSWRLWGRIRGVPDFFGTHNYYLGWNEALPAFLDMFGFGMCAAYAIVWLRQRPRAVHQLRYVATFVAVLSVVLVGYLFHWLYDVRYMSNKSDSWNDPVEIWRAENRQWLAILFFLILVSSPFAVRPWRRLLANRPLTFLSTISYNLYIWHVPVGQLIRDHHWWKAKTEPPMGDQHWQWTFCIIGITASILVATLITYCFERPLLRRGVRGALTHAWSSLRQASRRLQRDSAGATPTPSAEEPSLVDIS